MMMRDLTVSSGLACRRSRRIAGLAALCLAACTLVGPVVAGPTSDDALVAVVNGTEIRESDLALADVDLGKGLMTEDKSQRREQIITYLTDTILLAKAAQDQKVADASDIDRHVDYARRKFLMQRLVVVTGQKAATDEAVKKIY